MTTYEKIVKGATKIKVAAPKPKYIEPILMATSMNHQVLQENFNTIMRTLRTRLQDSSWSVVYKALIVIHIMIREGDGDVTLEYLAHQAPGMLNLSHSNISRNQASSDVRFIMRYSRYLHTRVKLFGETNVDYVRDERLKNLTDEQGGRLRTLPVDKGLIRELEGLQKQIDALLKNSFMENEVKNDVILTAFRLLVNDLLALFQELNEGVINLLEHYFEMSRYDAERALKVYIKFVDQTKYVIDYLRVAKHLEYATELHVPTIKHAPTALTSSLEEYLNDPNFEENRRRYMLEKGQKGKAPENNRDTQAQAHPTQVPLAPQAPSQAQFQNQTLPFPEQGQQQAQNNQNQHINGQDGLQRSGTLMVQQSTFNPWGGSVASPQQYQFAQAQAQPQATQINPAFTGAGFGGYGAQPQATGTNPFLQSQDNFNGFQQQPTQQFQQQPTQQFQQQPTQQFQQQPTQQFQQQPTQQFQQQPTQQFQQQPTQQFPQSGFQQQGQFQQQPIQQFQTGVQGSQTNLSAQHTNNPFSSLPATPTGQPQPVAVNSTNPFGNTRFANSGTTPYSFFQDRDKRVSVTATGSNPFKVSQTTTSVFDNAERQQPQPLQRQPTAGGLEHLPTIAAFPETQQEQLRNSYIQSAQTNLTAQATGQTQQFQQAHLQHQPQHAQNRFLQQQFQQQPQQQQAFYNEPSLI